MEAAPVDSRAIHPATLDELHALPELEAASDTLFEAIGIGPLPPAGPVEELRQALVVLVAGHPPRGFARIDRLPVPPAPTPGPPAPTAAAPPPPAPHLEQLAVHPDYARQGLGRALLQAAIEWARHAGFTEITLATYRDVPWNGPFYASEGFTEVGPVNDWYAARGIEPEDPVMARYGARVIMRRAL
jgi:GNAT superfamily N-acetyltransferase